MKRIAIIIPAYKGRFLREAIDSCLAQSYPDFEVVVVDDASPEGLCAIVSEFHDERIRYYRNARNFGAVEVVDNWNKCLEYVHGEYVICMGDDDRLTPCCLSEYARLIAKYPDCDVLHGWTEIIDEHGAVKEITMPRPETESAFSMLYHRWNGRKRQFIGDFCFKTEPLRQAGGFYKLPMAWGSDDISAFRVALHGGIANTQKVCFQYRQNTSTISNTGGGKIKMTAVLGEREWYLRQLDRIEASSLTPSPSPEGRGVIVLSETDQQYLQLIRKQLQPFFHKKTLYTCRTDMERHPMNVFYWYGERKKMGVTAKQLASTFLTAIKRRMMHK